MDIQALFALMNKKKASDMFFSVNSPIHLKVNGEIEPINDALLTKDAIKNLLSGVVSKEEMHTLETQNELNIGIPVSNIGRFRLSAFCQRGSISAVFRYIPFEIPSINDLNLPSGINDLITLKHGLILIVGATGSGKSSTIAALLDYRNEHQTGHILTLEEPIEFLFRSKKSIVNQRDIGTDTESLEIGLKNALRQAPDCILIGEIRDKETMSAAIAYAQTGHLVVATLHANNSYNALNRIMGFFPLETRDALLQDLSTTIRAIISQRLIKSKTGGRIPAVEVMKNTHLISELIEKGDLDHIRESIEKSLAPGSQTFEQALIKLIQDDLITAEDAMLYADSASNLQWMLNNMPNSSKTNNTSSNAFSSPEEKKEDDLFSGFSIKT